MQKTAKALITIAVLAAFAAALYFALRDHESERAARQEAAELAATAPLAGLISLDVEPFFNDERVQKLLAAHRLPVQVTRVGSRDMADKLAAGAAADFYFPSGVVAANQVVDAARKANLAAAQYSPFNTPMVIASWEPIARILEANGMAKPHEPKVWGVDMAHLTETMLAKKRWKDLQGAAAYNVTRSVLVSTTDVRRSNSAAMYLALTSHAVHGEVVTDRDTARATATRLAGLFKRQGYQENYVNGNFEDYVSIGIGKAPLAFIYEYQLVSYALARKGIGADMVLLYPEPTIVSKMVFVAASERAKALGELLSKDAELQRIAVEHGFRIAEVDRFVQTVKATGLAVQPRIAQVVDPPSFELMAEMIDVVAGEMAK